MISPLRACLPLGVHHLAKHVLSSKSGKHSWSVNGSSARWAALMRHSQLRPHRRDDSSCRLLALLRAAVLCTLCRTAAARISAPRPVRLPLTAQAPDLGYPHISVTTEAVADRLSINW